MIQFNLKQMFFSSSSEQTPHHWSSQSSGLWRIVFGASSFAPVEMAIGLSNQLVSQSNRAFRSSVRKQAEVLGDLLGGHPKDFPIEWKCVTFSCRKFRQCHPACHPVSRLFEGMWNLFLSAQPLKPGMNSHNVHAFHPFEISTLPTQMIW